MIENLVDFFSLYPKNWSNWWPQLLVAATVTVKLTVVSFALAVIIGIAVALGKLSTRPWIRRASGAYVEVARGIPALAILYLLYFGLLPLGIVLDAFTAGAIGLGMSAGGYMGEILRAGILAVHKGQREAAAAVGMSPCLSFRWIVFPQAMRTILPPIVNLLIGLIKDTSLCSLISSPELMLRAKDLAMTSFLPMHLFVLVAAIYFAIAWPMSLLSRFLERRMRVGDRAPA